MQGDLVVAILAVIAAPAAAIAILLLIRRRAPDGGYFNDGDRAAGVFGVLATGFSVLLGLIVVLAFSSYDESRSGSEREAQIVVQQYQTAQFLPEPGGADLAAELVCYGRYVVHREWPLMEDGEAEGTANPWSIALFETQREIEPELSSEESAYSTWFEQTFERQVARTDRVQGAGGIIPSSLWIVLLLSSSVIFGFMFFFADRGEHPVVQGMLIGTVVTVVVSTLFLIRFLESPYEAGIGSLQPEAMERTLRVLDSLEGVSDRSELPCNEFGDGLEQ